MASSFQSILAAISIVILLLLTVPIVSNLADTAPAPDERITRDAALLGDTSTFININDGEGINETVYKTTGYAVNLSGSSDSYVQSSQNVDFATDGNWTVSVWASVAPNAAIQDRTLLSLNGRLVITYYPMQGNWSAWFYDDGSTNSYQVNVSAVNVNGQLQNVMVRANGTHLTIYQNNTAGDTKNITTASITDAPVSPANWHGRIEEMRTFDEALDSTNRSAVVNSPAEQQPNLDTTARIMFDQPNRDTQLLLYADGHITQSNVTFSAGHPEDIVDSPSATNDILMDTDYEWRVHGPAIRPIDGRELDGAPVAYVSYDFGSDMVNDMVENISNALQLGALIPLVIITVVIVTFLQRARSM